jgi:hypothetical protein
MKAKLLVGLTVVLPMVVGVEAHAVVQTADWGGATVSMVYPEKVTYDTAFDFTFGVDSSTMGATDNDALAFLASLSVTDTVLYDHATWSYSLRSASDPTWSFSSSGTLGDAFTPLAMGTAGFGVTFKDPYMANFDDSGTSWLWKDYGDKLTWTVSGLVIRGDTNFSLRLDDYGYGTGPLSPSALVLDPPAPVAAVPEPWEGGMLAVGLPLVAWLVRRQTTARNRAAPVTPDTGCCTA